MFSGLQQGAALYVLDKSQEPKVVTGYVERVSLIHPMYPNYNPNASFGQNLQMAVDIVLKIGNDKKEFVGIPSNAAIHSYGDYVLSESREGMIQEVNALLSNSKSIIANVEQHKSNVAACEKILRELDPVYSKQQERDEAIDSLTKQVNSMQDILARLEQRLNP